MTPYFPTALVATSLAGAVLALGQPSGRVGGASLPGQFGLDAAASATWVENLSRTSHEPTRKHAMIYDFSVSADRHRQLASSWLLHLGAVAEYQAVPEYDRTGSGRLGVQTGLQKKFGLGPYAPVLQFDPGFAYKAAQLADDRGWSTDASLRLTKRFHPALKMSVAGQWLRHDADSPIFDIEQRSWSVDVAWDINDLWRLTGSTGRLHGTIVANAAWSIWSMAIGGAFGPAISSYYNSIPWGTTELYGTGWVSYRVEADVDLWSLAVARELSHRLTLELRSSGVLVENKVGIRYPAKSWGLGFNYRF